MKIYLAGPDVFRPDAPARAEHARELCRRYGFDALTPLDHPETQPDRIFQENLALIRKAQIVVADLNPFRGAEPDSGTSFELGFALALGKKLFGYVRQRATQVERVCRFEGRDRPLKQDDRPIDGQGWFIEDFGLPCNLMLAEATQIVEGDLEDCLRAIRPARSQANAESAG